MAVRRPVGTPWAGNGSFGNRGGTVTSYRINNRTYRVSNRPIRVNNRTFNPNPVSAGWANRAPRGANPVVWGRRSAGWNYYGPAPAYGNTYNYYGRQAFYTGDYHYDQAYGRPLVQRFYDPYWGGNNYRYGYYQYSPAWHESNFFFNYYSFTPYAEPCYASPYYYYSCLPPYVPATRVIIVEQPVVVNWNEGDAYQYQPQRSYQSYGVSELNASLDALSAVYHRNDERALDSILPSSGQVAIFQEDKYMYSLNDADFRQMVRDNMHDVKTTNFQYTYVRRHGNDAIVKARHDFQDPRGGTDTVFQLYRLRREGNRYVVTDFMTSHAPIRKSHF